MFRILRTYGACISFLHQGTVCYCSYDPSWLSVVLHWHGPTNRVYTLSCHENILSPANEMQFTDSIQLFTDDPLQYGCIGQPFFFSQKIVAVWFKESKQNSCSNRKVFQITTTTTTLNHNRSFVSRGRQLTWNRRWGTDGLWPGRRCLLGERYRGVASHPSFFS